MTGGDAPEACRSLISWNILESWLDRRHPEAWSQGHRSPVRIGASHA
jgi:hypothetical protein